MRNRPNVKPKNAKEFFEIKDVQQTQAIKRISCIKKSIIEKFDEKHILSELKNIEEIISQLEKLTQAQNIENKKILNQAGKVLERKQDKPASKSQKNGITSAFNRSRHTSRLGKVLANFENENTFWTI